MASHNPLSSISRSSIPIILIAAIIALWFPLTKEWSDFHGYLFSLESPELIYSDTVFRPFFLLPWAIPLLAPFALIPAQLSWIIYNLLALTVILITIFYFDPRPNWLTLAACFLNFVFILYASLGQWEAWQLGFAILAIFAIKHKRPILMGLALLLLTTKPLLVTLVGLTLLWHIRPWTLIEKLRILIIPAAGALASFLLFPRWPADYLHFVGAFPPQNIIALDFSGGVTFELKTLNPPLWLIGLSIVTFIGFCVYFRPTLNLAIAAAFTANLLITNYLQLYHFIFLIPAIILLGAASRPSRLLIVFLISTIPLQFFLLDGLLLGFLPFVILILLMSQTSNIEQFLSRNSLSTRSS